MSGTLPTWLERLLGIEPGPGEGTVWSLENRWPWPPWVTLLLAVAAVVFVAAIYLREGRQAGGRYRAMLAVMRLAIIALVLGMIAQFASVSADRLALRGRAGRRFVEHDHRRSL